MACIKLLFFQSDSQSRTRTKIYVFFSGFEGPMKKEKDFVAKLGNYEQIYFIW